VIGLLKACYHVYRNHGIIAAVRAWRCGWWFGREKRRRGL
jgi:hypothetical protein